MKKLLTSVALVASLLAGSAHAEPMVGKKLAAGPSGQPFCLELDGLKEFMIAAMTDDTVAVGAILKEGTCTMIKKGIPLSVLEDLGDEDDELHGVKIRAMGPKGSVIGYSLSVGMVDRK